MKGAELKQFFVEYEGSDFEESSDLNWMGKLPSSELNDLRKNEII